MKHYTENEKKFIKNNFMNKANIELAKILKRTPLGIAQLLNRMDLRRPKGKGHSLTKGKRKKYPNSFWIDNKEQFLKDNFMIKGNVELAKILNTTSQHIADKLCYMNLKRPRGKGQFLSSKNKTWSDKNKFFLKDNYMIKGNIELAKILNTTPNRVSWKLADMGLKRPFKGKYFIKKTEFKKGSHASKKTEFKKGKLHRYFNNWSSKEPYGIKFYNKRNDIIGRDEICQVCFKSIKERRTIHHIDYNKKNNEGNNLILLCNSCHNRTNFNRKFWVDLFQSRQKTFQINPLSWLRYHSLINRINNIGDIEINRR